MWPALSLNGPDFGPGSRPLPWQSLLHAGFGGVCGAMKYEVHLAVRERLHFRRKDHDDQGAARDVSSAL